MKRKASTLDEQCIPYYQPNEFVSSSSPTVSNPTPATVLTYFSTRTLKRYRDNRPDESIVHATTLARLFDAQKRHVQAETRPSLSIDQQQLQQYSGHPYQNSTSDPAQTSAAGYAFDQTTPTTTLTVNTDPTQRNIDSFFSQSRDAFPKPSRKSADFFFATTAAANKSNITLPANTSTHIAPFPSSYLPRCEDCNHHLPLLAQNAITSTSTNTPTDGMDIDSDLDFDLARPISPSLFTEFECSRCFRRVCDLCAVRGDRRICLECFGKNY